MKLIFDIGANAGKTVEFYKDLCEKIVCFEPNPDFTGHLKKYFNNQNVVVDSRALSNEVGKKIFMISNANTLSTFSDDWINNSRFTGKYLWNKEVEVQTTTLDEIINEYGKPDFVKIDVEGYEYEVLTGLTILLDDTIFCFEWAEEQYERIMNTVKYLNSLGYSNFGYTDCDAPSIGDNIDFKSWEMLDIHHDINPQRKERWGMIYFKK